MQITIDSTEPLAKVTAVVGALYGVELVVAGDSQPAESTGRRRSRAVASSASAKRAAGRGRRGGQRQQQQKVDPKVVRQWAVEQGMTVSSRGQLSKAVLDAYSSSQS